MNMVPVAENILNNAGFYACNIDTPKEDGEQHEKRECLRGVLRNLKENLPGRIKQRHMKTLIKQIAQRSIKYMLNTICVN